MSSLPVSYLQAYSRRKLVFAKMDEETLKSKRRLYMKELREVVVEPILPKFKLIRIVAVAPLPEYDMIITDIMSWGKIMLACRNEIRRCVVNHEEIMGLTYGPGPGIWRARGSQKWVVDTRRDSPYEVFEDGDIVHITMIQVQETWSPLKVGVYACANCGELENATKWFKKCAACKAKRYCSVECQRANWPQHKSECSALAESEGSGAERQTTYIYPLNHRPLDDIEPLDVDEVLQIYDCCTKCRCGCEGEEHE